MVTLYYRGMAAKDNKPKLGRSARLLGIRPGIDIDVTQMPQGWLDHKGCLRSELDRVDSDQQIDVAIRNTKGMSTSLSIEGLGICSKIKYWNLGGLRDALPVGTPTTPKGLKVLKQWKKPPSHPLQVILKIRIMESCHEYPNHHHSSR